MTQPTRYNPLNLVDIVASYIVTNDLQSSSTVDSKTKDFCNLRIKQIWDSLKLDPQFSQFMQIMQGIENVCVVTSISQGKCSPNPSVEDRELVLQKEINTLFRKLAQKFKIDKVIPVDIETYVALQHVALQHVLLQQKNEDKGLLHIWELIIGACREKGYWSIIKSLPSHPTPDKIRTWLIDKKNARAINFIDCMCFHRNQVIPPEILFFPKLKEIRIFEFQQEAIPEILSKIPRLEILTFIGSHKISVIPDSLSELKLKELYLDHCQIETIPDFLGQMTSLKKLYLNNNKIKVIPDFDQLTRLEYLDLSQNQIEVIPDSLFKLISLRGKKLCCILSGNPLLLNQLESKGFMLDAKGRLVSNSGSSCSVM